MTDIRTPDDEVTTPGWFLPPFRPGWTYQAATYPGHSAYAVDFNRRTPTGGWLDDNGDPVLAAADGTVVEVDKSEGLVLLGHGALWRTEYRHMQDIPVKVGDKVQRGDRIGAIGSVGRSTAPHLHHVQWRRPGPGKPYQRVQASFAGEPLRVSVGDSDTRPASWDPPEPVLLQGPPERATWEGAFREAFKRLGRVQAAADACLTAKSAAEAALADERASSELLRTSLATCQAAEKARCDQLDVLEAELAQVRASLAECEARPVPDCGTLEAERDAALAIVDAVRRAVERRA